MSKPQAEIISEDIEIYGILKEIFKSKEKLWVWQTNSQDQKRVVHYGVLRKIDVLKKTIELRPNNEKGFNFDKNKDLFLFSQTYNVAFKVTIRTFEPDLITFLAPSKLNKPAQELANNIELIEKENEKAHEHERLAPRMNAKDQVIAVKKLDLDGAPMEFYHLYDISQGGMGIRVEDPAEFEVDERLEAVNINGKPLDKPLKGKVVAIRQMDDLLGSFKVGVKFE